MKNKNRIFVLDVDGDSYPDIIASDSTLNTVGILFNPGKTYWKKKKLLKGEQSLSNPWTFIPIIDVEKYGLKSMILKDFSIYMVKKRKRINFELFVIYDNQICKIHSINIIYRLVYRRRFGFTY